MKPALLVLLVAFALQVGGTAAISPTAPVAASSAADPIARTRAWLKRFREGRERIDDRSAEELRTLIDDLRLTWSIDPARSDAAADALLDFVGAALTAFDPEAMQSNPSPTEALRDVAAEVLRAHLSDELVRRIVHEVLALPQSQPLARRVAAAWLLTGVYHEESKLALFECARSGEPELRNYALQALTGWNDESVSAFFLDLASSPAAPAIVSLRTEQHFQKLSSIGDPRLRARLAAYVQSRMISLDWREASRAIALSNLLEHRTVVPALIESLAAWKQRGEAGAQALRVELELQRALERRSGRTLGLHPENWLAWWEAVQRGDVRGQGIYSTGVQEPLHKTFFGLHPATDRLVFVIDRSGSMELPFAPNATQTTNTGRTRWQEAVEQLVGFVSDLGPGSRFNVILFHDYAESWRPHLVAASPENSQRVREWLTRRPGGGTQLRAGVQRALDIQADGTIDLAKQEADTVIVLCDGETNEGPGWVPPFLERTNALARVMFHGVQIGGQGDGTLELLAKGTGGQYVKTGE